MITFQQHDSAETISRPHHSLLGTIMGRGGRRNRKRKLTEGEAAVVVVPETPTAIVRWWDDGHQAATDPETQTEPHEPPPEALEWLPDSTAKTTSNQELVLLQQYYSWLAEKYRWNAPTMVQSYAWPHVFWNNNPQQQRPHVAFVSATASGKTLVFGLKLLIRAHEHGQHGLVLVPTRELALQVGSNLVQWNAVIESQNADAKTASRTSILTLHGGGESAKQQVVVLQKSIHKGPVLMVATPGRFRDVLERIEQSFHIATICLDEADRLSLQSDLCQQVDDILDRVVLDKKGSSTRDYEQQQQQQQLCLCSATLSATAQSKWTGWIQRMPQQTCVLVQIGTGPLVVQGSSAEGVQANAATHQESPATSPTQIDSPCARPSSATSNLFSRIPTNLTQVLHVCAEHKKARKLITTLQSIRQDSNNHNNNKSKGQGLGIVFFNRIKTLQFASKLLQKNQIQCLELHSQMPQDRRERAIQTFASGRVALLLATDVAARGLHIDHVKTVVNYDMPSNLEQYIHRCGRAGRTQPTAGGGGSGGGVAYSFFTRNFSVMAKDMVELLRATNQHVDPNLLELVREEEAKKSGAHHDGAAKRQRTDAKRDESVEAAAAAAAAANHDDAEDIASDSDDSVAGKDHPGNRIMLRRAGNISDASSDSDDDKDDEEE